MPESDAAAIDLASDDLAVVRESLREAFQFECGSLIVRLCGREAGGAGLRRI